MSKKVLPYQILGDNKALSHKAFDMDYNQSNSTLSSPKRITAMSSLPEKLANEVSNYVVVGKDSYTFFNDGTYARFDASTGKLDNPKKVSAGFPGITDAQAVMISAMVYDQKSGYFHIFFNDGTTMTYNYKDKKAVPDDRTGKTSEKWPGVTDEDAKQITAVIESSQNYYLFVLKNGT